MRSQLWGPAAKQLGFLGKNVDIDPMNYVFRLYNVPLIANNLDKFRNIARSGVLENWRSVCE